MLTESQMIKLEFDARWKRAHADYKGYFNSGPGADRKITRRGRRMLLILDAHGCTVLVSEPRS